MPMTSKLGTVMTYYDGLLTYQSPDPLTTWYCLIT